jgi:predicted dehydrogenase
MKDGRDRLGVGVIGLGVGEQHVHAFAAHSSCRLSALCDFDSEKLRSVAERFPGVRLYADSRDLIGDPSVQIVAIASNDDDHAAQVIQALNLGKHVFVEKPLCLDRDQLRGIASAWRKANGPRLSTNTVLRRSPRFMRLKRDIDEGRLGTIFCIEADYIYGRLHKLSSGWRGAIPNYSVMLGGGIHMVDLGLWLSGQRPVEVIAYESSLGSTGSGFRGIDLVQSLLRFDSGLVAKISANFASHYPHYHRLHVYGTEGTFENVPNVIGPAALLWRGRDDGKIPEPILEPYPSVGKGDLIPAFVDAVTGRGQADVPEEEVFASVSVCLAIEQSIAEHRLVRVEYEAL